MISARCRSKIRCALERFTEGNLAANARNLLKVLGYTSHRTLKIQPNTTGRFTEMLNSYRQLNPEKALLHEWNTVDFLFQITDDEIVKGIRRDTNFGPGATFDASIYQSYLFLAVKLRGKDYSRAALARITREINKVFAMPALLIFQHGHSLTFAIIHRGPGRNDALEKVSFIKDIDVVSPHRAHVEILAELSVAPLYREHKFSNFLELHQAWQKTLDISILNRRFYKEIVDWYFSAMENEQFSADAAHIVWLIMARFLKEKGARCDEKALDRLRNHIESESCAYQAQRELVQILNRYKFTIAENTLLEEEVALDAEVLGKVFENLLAVDKGETPTTARKQRDRAVSPTGRNRDREVSPPGTSSETPTTARKQTGAYYTPREIVNFMVDASLFACLKETLDEGPGVETILRHLFADNDEPHQFTEAEATRLVQRIASLKILEPACGTGAFLMGILQKLVFLLRKLDLHNTQWGQLQAEPEEAFEKNTPDYNRKFYLIKNCIYGVDIQPLAIEIAKFRLFLSLIADEGHALPDLDSKFFCADTLLGMPTLPQFDIVIGNPPYAKGEHLGHTLREQLKQHYGWAGDLCDYFIFAGFERVAENGIFAYIANDSYVAFSTKRRIRALFLENQLLHLVKAPAETFGAAVYTAIFILSKQKAAASHAYMSGEIGFPDFHYRQNGEVAYATIHQMPDKEFLLAKEDGLMMRLLSFEKMEKFCHILDTGINSGNVRKKLFFKEDNGNRHRLLQGRQIQRFSVQWDSPKAKYQFCDIDYEPLPIPGIGRGGKPSRRNEHWGFGGAIENHHQPERLLMRQTDDDLIVAYHSEAELGRFYTDNTLHTILPKSPSVNLKYFLALFNSRLLNFVYHFVSQEAGKSQAQVKVAVVRKLPVVVPTEAAQRPIVALVDKILSAKGEDTAEFEKEIDRHVYALYGLSEAEIRVVEQAE